MRRTLVLTAVLLAAAVPATAGAAAAPPLTPVAAVPTATAAASAAWQDREGTHVLRDDQPLGGETLLHPPAGCTLGGLTASDVAYGCLTDKPDLVRVWLQDRGTEALRSSPIGFGQGGAAGEFYELRGIGSKLGGIYTSGAPHVDEQTEYRRLSDGRRIAAPRASAHRVVSLDAASGTVKLCAPLAVGTHVEEGVDEVNGEYTETVPDDAAYRAPWLLTVHRARVLLKRCGSWKTRDLGQAGEDTRLVLTRRYAAWGSARFASEWRVRRLAHGSSFRVGPGLPSGWWHVAATDRRLWIGDDDQRKAYMIEP